MPAPSSRIGTGEIDLRALIDHMEASGYRGFYVVEISPKDRENTLRYFAEAWEYLAASAS
jgi:sugar phosphate isomerase/epimerase